jgi:dipeptidase E
MRNLLLVSNSTVFGRGYLDHAEAQILETLGDAKRVLFVPYALFDRNEYAAKARERFAAMGRELDSIHQAADPRRAVETAESIFIGGGNTWRLLKLMYENELVDAIRVRVAGGMPYIGSSAGSNVAGATIRTTNDMPIVEPRSWTALGLVTFQLNPHYLDPHDKSKHMGETREERIMQFHEENITPVCGLREGTMLRVVDEAITLIGEGNARIFRRGETPLEMAPGSRLERFLEG